MYKLMLVDDEDVVRHQVIGKIDWHQYGFEIVCEAENGQEALEFFEQYQPDVVITDIKMPFMDGLELSKRILEKYPYTKIIVLTGFDEFEYAKKSINLHITNYILKPVSAKELIQILVEVKANIDQEIQEKQDLKRLKRHYATSYDMMKNKFLESLVQDSVTTEKILPWLSYYKIQLDGDIFIVSVVQIDNIYEGEPDITTIELKKIALLDMIQEAGEAIDLGIYFLVRNEVVILSAGEEEEKFVVKHIQKLEKIRQATEKFLPFAVTIGCGQVCYDLSQLYMSRREANNACDYKTVVGNNQVIYIKDVERNKGSLQTFDEKEQHQLEQVLRKGSKEGYQIYLQTLFNQVTLLPEDYQQMYLLEILTTLIKLGKKLTGQNPTVFMDQSTLQEIMNLQEALSFKQYKLLQLGKEILNIASETRQTSNNSLVTKAEDYVEAHYKDWDLNIEKISAYLHYSPNYFSSMFKRETGKAFMNYLGEIRIKKAKILLKTSQLKNFEIAMEVGFSSANYFSFCFKKITKISPTQYRKVNEQGLIKER